MTSIAREAARGGAAHFPDRIHESYRIPNLVPEPGLRFTDATFGEYGYGIGSDGPLIPSGEYATQFFILQLTNAADGRHEVTDALGQEPRKQSSELPDLRMRIKMECFHMGQSEKDQIKPNDTAALHLTIGSDTQPTQLDASRDPLLWTVTTGLQLFDPSIKRPTLARSLTSDFAQSMGNRAFEVPGSLAKIRFEIKRQRRMKDPWWKQLLAIGASPGVNALAPVFGFPALTTTAATFIDHAVTRFMGDGSEVLFASRFIPYALNLNGFKSSSRDGFRSSCLNPGTWILVRGGDRALLRKHFAVYDSELGALVPAEHSRDETMKEGYINPLRVVTYAVLTVDVEEVKLATGTIK
jgi:hypothetical protein